MSKIIANPGQTGTYVNFYTPSCMACGESTVVMMHPADLNRWLNGELIQHVFPNLSAADREIIKTGTHPICWQEMFDMMEQAYNDEKNNYPLPDDEPDFTELYDRNEDRDY